MATVTSMDRAVTSSSVGSSQRMEVVKKAVQLTAAAP